MKKRYKFLIGLGICLFILPFWYQSAVEFDVPNQLNLSTLDEKRTTLNDSTFQIKNNWLRKNRYDTWELYVEGNPLERGIRMGKLMEELLQKQEQAFFTGMQDVMPSMNYMQFLKYIVAWQNRNLDEYIPIEYQREIYGMSLFAADEFDFIGPKYQRKLIYHAAHDIGHTLQNMGLVGSGCTTLSAWDEATADSSLLLARNFDFYVGDEFAEQKVAYFVKPTEGHPYFSYSWPGLMGMVSGMNFEGLAIVLNAGPPSIPGASKTPVSILAREILQYASNIEEAVSIAKKREVFVSENFIISSAKDNKTVVIEKSPDQTILYESESHNFVCSNHFQSDFFKNKEENLMAKEQTSTVFRYERMSELLDKKSALNVQDAIEILRDLSGKNDTEIGMGNEMALNQLQAHHSIVFKPEKLEIWVSTRHWQLGEFIHYDLKDIFENKSQSPTPVPLFNEEKTVAADSIIYSEKFHNYLIYRNLKKRIKAAIADNLILKQEKLSYFATLNPENYETWSLLGQYFQTQNDCKKAVRYFELALLKAIPWKKDKEAILEWKEECN